MYAIVYFNWSGNKQEFEEAKKAMEKISTKFDDITLVDILKPSSEWNYAALLKFKEFKSFLKYTKQVREEPLSFFQKRGLEAPPRKLELLVDLDQIQ